MEIGATEVQKAFRGHQARMEVAEMQAERGSEHLG